MTRTLAALSLVALASLFAPPIAAKEEPPEASTSAAADTPGDAAISATARDRYDKARAAWRSENYEGCRAQATAAYAVHAHPKIAAVLGDCALSLGRHLEAAQNLNLAAEGLKTDPNQKLRDHVLERLEQAESHVVKLVFTLNVTGAELRVDGGAAKPIDAAPFYLEPGEHALSVQKAGYQKLERPVSGEAGSVQALQLRLEPIEAGDGAGGQGDGPPDDGRTPDGDGTGSVIAGTVLAVLGVGGIGVGIGLTVAAGSKSSRIDELDLATGGDRACVAPAPSVAGQCEELAGTIRAHDNFRRGAVAGFIAGGAFLAAGAGMLIYQLSSSPAERKASTSIHIRPGGLTLRGTF